MSVDLPLIIVNPTSGRGTSEQGWASMVNTIRTHFGPFDCEFTRKRGDAIEVARREALQGRKLIVAMGGDGTISEVANGILLSGTEAELGILPRGTGGDFRRTLKLPSNLTEAAKRLRNGTTHRMDVGILHYVDHEGNQAKRFFVNTASFGMSGKVASRVNQSSKRLGGVVSYFGATVQTVFTYSYPEVTLQFDDQPAKRLKVITVCVANGPTFGGGMRIAPEAKLNDGTFDVVIVGDLTTSRALLNSYKLYTGSFLSVDKVALVRAKKVSAVPIENDAEILLEVDGETPGRLPAAFEILPSALRIRC